jgi:chaperonin cofactor prefoldin
MLSRLIMPLVLLSLAACPCLGQAQDPAAGSSSSSKPADPPANPPSPTSPDKKTPKKVWTNEDMSSVHGTISVVGDEKPSPTRSDRASSQNSGHANDLRQQQIEKYRNQIQQIQGQIESIDKRIAQLKNFKAEDTSPSGGINPNQGYNMVPLEDQVKQLEEKKKQLQAKIEDIENEAHKNGIDSGDLR